MQAETKRQKIAMLHRCGASLDIEKVSLIHNGISISVTTDFLRGKTLLFSIPMVLSFDEAMLYVLAYEAGHRNAKKK